MSCQSFNTAAVCECMLGAAGLVSERSFVDMSYAFLIRHENAESGLDME